MMTSIDQGDANNSDVMMLGEALAAFLADDGLPLHCALRFRLTAAGSVTNVAAALARLDHRTGYATRLGDDALGNGVLTRLGGTGVEVACQLGHQTAAGLLLRDVSGSRPTEMFLRGQRISGKAGSPGQVSCRCSIEAPAQYALSESDDVAGAMVSTPGDLEGWPDARQRSRCVQLNREVER